MKPFASLDEVLDAGALIPTERRNVAPPAGEFQPLFSGNALNAAAYERADEPRHEAPEIELVEANGRVQQVIVTCRCGERTVLDCAY